MALAENPAEAGNGKRMAELHPGGIGGKPENGGGKADVGGGKPLSTFPPSVPPLAKTSARLQLDGRAMWTYR
jgi:hypothetical protein